MTKILYLPINYNLIQQGMYEGIRESGCELEVFDFFYYYNDVFNKRVDDVRKHLIKVAIQTNPDILLMQIQHTTIINADTIDTIKRHLPKCIVINYTQDVRSYIQSTYKKMAEVSHYNFIPNTSQLQEYSENIGKDIKFWQIGYSPILYNPELIERTEFEYDVSFIANNNTEEKYPGRGDRERAARLLRDRFGDRFGFFGHGWPKDLKCGPSIEQKEAGAIYKKSFCSVSINHFNNLDHYFSDRLIMALACSRPVIALAFNGWQSYLLDGGDCLIADTVDDIPNIVEMLKNNKDYAFYIGKSGANKAIHEHSYYSRVQEMLNIIGIQ